MRLVTPLQSVSLSNKSVILLQKTKYGATQRMFIVEAFIRKKSSKNFFLNLSDKFMQFFWNLTWGPGQLLHSDLTPVLQYRYSSMYVTVVFRRKLQRLKLHKLNSFQNTLISSKLKLVLVSTSLPQQFPWINIVTSDVGHNTYFITDVFSMQWLHVSTNNCHLQTIQYITYIQKCLCRWKVSIKAVQRR
jgi:hypothetical protein